MNNIRFLEKKNRYYLTKFSKLLDVIMSRTVGSDSELFGPMEKTVNSRYFNTMLKERMFDIIGKEVDATSTCSTFDDVLHLSMTKNKLFSTPYLNSILYTVDMDEFNNILSNAELTEYIINVGTTVKAYREIIRSIRRSVDILNVKYGEFPSNDYTGMRLSYFHVPDDIDEYINKGLLERNDNRILKELSYDDLNIEKVLAHVQDKTDYVNRRLKSLGTGRIGYLFNNYIKDMNKAKVLLKPRTRKFVNDCLDTITLLRSMASIEDVGIVSTLGNNYDEVFEDNVSALSHGYMDFLNVFDNSKDGSIIGYATEDTVEVFSSKVGDGFPVKRLLGLATIHTGMITDGMVQEKHEELWEERLSLHKLRTKRDHTVQFKRLIFESIENLVSDLSDDTKKLFGGCLSEAIENNSNIEIDFNRLGSFFMKVIHEAIYSYRGLDFRLYHKHFKILLDPNNKLTKESIVVLATSNLIVSNLLNNTKIIDLDSVKG